MIPADWLPTPTIAQPRQPSDWLARCPYCDQPVWRVEPYGGPSGASDYDWRPWTLSDEFQPATLTTAAQKRRWAEERPYRLGLVAINFATGHCVAATDKPRQKPRDRALYRAH